MTVPNLRSASLVLAIRCFGRKPLYRKQALPPANEAGSTDRTAQSKAIRHCQCLQPYWSRRQQKHSRDIPSSGCNPGLDRRRSQSPRRAGVAKRLLPELTIALGDNHHACHLAYHNTRIRGQQHRARSRHVFAVTHSKDGIRQGENERWRQERRGWPEPRPGCRLR